MAPPKNAPHQLLVEGIDDKYSVIELLKRHGLDWDQPGNSAPYVHSVDGVDNFASLLPLFIKGTYKRVGIVVDADLDLDARWKSMARHFEAANIEFPRIKRAQSTIVSLPDEDRHFGVWMMPDNQASGGLEDFLASLVPPADPCWAYSEEATTRARELGAAFSELHYLKARLHTWLAWQEKPGLPFGSAIHAHYFDHDTPMARLFITWFCDLFDVKLAAPST